MQTPCTVGITLKLSIMFIQNSGHSIFHNHNEDSIHNIRHQHQPLAQLQHHASCVQTHTGGIHSSRSYSRGSDTHTDQHQHRGQLQHHASYVLGYTGDIHSSRGCSRGSESRTGDQHQHWGQLQRQHHASYVLRNTGEIHSSRSYSRGSDSRTDQHQHQPQGPQQHPAVLQPVQGQQTPTKP